MLEQGRDFAEESEAEGAGIIESARISRTVRFVRSPRLVERSDAHRPPSLWLLFHGYAESAPGFFENCQPLLVASGLPGLAPEGASRFYSRSGAGDVVASWMTKVERHSEITEYLRFIDGLVDRYLPDQQSSLRILGFSQGVATALRFAAHTDRPITDLVLWSAGFASDELAEIGDHLRSTGRITLVTGENDRLVPKKTVDRLADDLVSLGIVPTILNHAGRHELDEELLVRIGERKPESQ